MVSPVDHYFPNHPSCVPIMPLRDAFGNAVPDPNMGLASLSPSLFTSLDGGAEDIHDFVYRSLLQILRDEATIRQVAAEYFGTVNTWFTIVEQASFYEDLDNMFSARSAEVGLLVLCMLLITRTPQQTPGSNMQEGLYLSVKTTFTIVEAKVPLSKHLLQANLLIAMYEHGQSMPQQAYCSLGTCIRMTRAFGWHQQGFWTDERQKAAPAELKMCSLLWWATVFVDWFVAPTPFRVPSTWLLELTTLPRPELTWSTC